MEKEDVIIKKLDEILEYLKSRKPEVDEKLALAVKCVCDPHGSCPAEYRGEKCECGCEDEQCDCEECDCEECECEECGCICECCKSGKCCCKDGKCTCDCECCKNGSCGCKGCK